MSILEELGVSPIINASGSVTRLGGAPMPQAVVDAWCSASRQWAPLEQLQAAASRVIGDVTGAEAGLVTSGCAAALTLGTAAILTGWDTSKMERLPVCRGFANKMVVAREQRSGYDHAVRAAGAELAEVGFNEVVAGAGVRRTEAWEYESAFGSETAGVLYVYTADSQPPLADVVELAHRHNLPVLVDAAGELPPRENLRLATESGADLVAFSGGKGVRGPQATGILCGRRDLIGSAAVQMLDMDDHPELWVPPAELIDRTKMAGVPRHGIGRGMKVAKEQIVALCRALKLFAAGEFDAELLDYRRYLQIVRDQLADTAAACEDLSASHESVRPRMTITVPPSRDAFEICRQLRRQRPAIYVGHGLLAAGKLVIDPFCLNDDQAAVLADRLRAVLLD